MELLILVLVVLTIVAIEETRLWLDRKASAKLVKKYELLMQEHQAVERDVSKVWIVRSRYEMECL